MMPKYPEKDTPTLRAFEWQFQAKRHGQNLLHSRVRARACGRSAHAPQLFQRNDQAKKDCPLPDSAGLLDFVPRESGATTAGARMPLRRNLRRPRYLCSRRRGAWKQQAMYLASRRVLTLPGELHKIARPKQRKRGTPCDAEQYRCRSVSAQLKEQRVPER